MFCPKCGTENPKTGRFCRKCGSDLSVISEAISGNLQSQTPVEPLHHKGKRRPRDSWESAMGTLFMGIAFLAVSIALGISGAAEGKRWWFWLLIPAFGMIGSGVAQTIRLKQTTLEEVTVDADPPVDEREKRDQAALPPTQTEYVSPIISNYRTGDLVPSSVVEQTTRNLKTDSEGETMTLPEDRV